MNSAPPGSKVLHVHANAGFGGVGVETLTPEDFGQLEHALHLGVPSTIQLSDAREVQVVPRDWMAVGGSELMLKRFVQFSSALLDATQPCPNARKVLAQFPCSCQEDSPCYGARPAGTMPDGMLILEKSSSDLPGLAVGTAHYRAQLNITPVGFKPFEDRHYFPAHHRSSQMILFALIHSVVVRTLYKQKDADSFWLECDSFKPCRVRCNEPECLGSWPDDEPDSYLQAQAEELQRLCCSQNVQHAFVYRAMLLESDPFYQQMLAI